MGKLRMLAACEMSGRVADAFARRGWEAHSADLLPSELPDTDYRDVISVLSDSASGTHGSYRHRQCDVRDLFSWDHPVNARRQDLAHMTGLDLPLWDLVVAFPPCTHLSLAGARYWKEKRADGRQDEAADFFLEMLQAPAPHIAVENPRGDMTRRYRPPDQYVQPWWFGDPLFKATGLWLRDLPPAEGHAHAGGLRGPEPGHDRRRQPPHRHAEERPVQQRS